jgi:hypothetical protein
MALIPISSLYQKIFNNINESNIVTIKHIIKSSSNESKQCLKGLCFSVQITKAPKEASATLRAMKSFKNQTKIKHLCETVYPKSTKI